MKTMCSHLRTLAFSALLFAAPHTAANAQTVEAALERFKALIEEQGVSLDWESADISGPDAVLTGLTISFEDMTVPISRMTLAGISEVDEGYRIESISQDDLYADDGAGSSFALRGVRMGGVVLPREGAETLYGGFVFYETASVGGIAVNVTGVDVFTMNDLHFEMAPPVDGSPMEYTSTAESFTIDLSLAEGSDQYEVLQALGYDRITGYLEGGGSWQPADGRLTLSQNDITVIDAGTFSLSIDLSGYTPAFIAALRDIQQQMAANPDGDNAAQGFAILGLMQQLTFYSAEIAFADDSLTNRVLEFVARMQGIGVNDLKNQAKGLLPFVLAQLGNPELTTATVQAVSRFLDDPQVLRVTAEPAEPVPFAVLIAEGMSAPEGLTRTLAVTVTAND